MVGLLGRAHANRVNKELMVAVPTRGVYVVSRTRNTTIWFGLFWLAVRGEVLFVIAFVVSSSETVSGGDMISANQIS